ncbi:MAG: recombination mediator RecR [Saprospiraceae bacterium]|nr:recombination mediator RecR [Saprospiraceae bacterium]
MKFSSKTLENAVEALATLPSVGRKSALRLALHLIKDSTSKSVKIASALVDLENNINYCQICFNISDANTCEICKEPQRNKELVCVVESVRDVMAIEETTQFNGLYHVLGGVISPMDGVGPGDLTIESLEERAKTGEIKELIMAISPTIEGDTTIYYLSKQMEKYDIEISTIARGVSFGGELEYADELTLGRSIVARVPYSSEH